MDNKRIIPESWEKVKLENICEIITGNTPPKNDKNNYGSFIPFVKPPQLYDRPINDAPEKLSIAGAKLGRILPKNSVLVTCIGNLGRTAINKVEVAFNQQINAMVPSKALNSHYLFYQAQSSDFKKQLESLASATTVAIVNKGKFQTIQIALAPFAEQHRIVDKLEELFSDLDKGIESLKTAQQQLKIYRQAVLKSAFEGKFTEGWRVKQKNIISAEAFVNYSGNGITWKGNDKCYKIKNLHSLTKDELSKLPILPDGWTWVKLGEYAFVTKLAGFEFTKYVKYKNEGEIPVIRAQNVAKDRFIPRNFIYVDREIMKQLPRSRVYGGEVLMVFVGAGLGNVGIVPEKSEYFLGPNVAKIALSDAFFNKYISLFLSSTSGFENVAGMSKATAQGSISMANIREVPVPMIPLEEQYQIVQEIESRLSVCDKIEETIEETLKQSEALRQSIFKKAFEGKLVPQDPNDEPASKLLERI